MPKALEEHEQESSITEDLLRLATIASLIGYDPVGTMPHDAARGQLEAKDTGTAYEPVCSAVPDTENRKIPQQKKPRQGEHLLSSMKARNQPPREIKCGDRIEL